MKKLIIIFTITCLCQKVWANDNTGNNTGNKPATPVYRLQPYKQKKKQKLDPKILKQLDPYWFLTNYADTVFSGSVTANSFIKAGGTSSQFLMADGSILAAGNNISISDGTISATGFSSGTGTNGQVSFWNGSNTQTGSNNLFWDNANQRLGIGTSSPIHMLDITTNKTGDAQGSTIRINRPNNNSYENGINWATGGVNQWFLGVDNNSTEDFYLYNWTRNKYDIAVLGTSGNVGIGTTTPNVGEFGSMLTVFGAGSNPGVITSARLSNGIGWGTGFQNVLLNSAGTPVSYSYFNGSIESNTAGAHNGSMSLFTATNGSLTEKMRITATGNVGIGTSTPAAGRLLDVAGEVAINGLRIGRGAGNHLSNTALGYSALNNNSTGSGNFAAGYNAMLDNTTGYYNLAIGTEALRYNTTGSNNIAIGVQTFGGQLTGNQNIGIGNFALSSTGSVSGNNVAIGFTTMGNATGGTENTAIGNFALRYNTTGGRNVASGMQSLGSNTTGNGNTASGYQSLFFNTTGSSNTSSGYQSLFANTTGGNNAAYGRDALQLNTTGNNNTAIGNLAGITTNYINANTTGNNNTWIGNNSGPATTTQLTNATAIGNNALNTASNQVVLGSTAVTETLLRGLVGISQTNPTAIVDLAASTTTNASLRLRDGVAPSAPNEGDIWKTSTALMARVNGTNVTIGGSGGIGLINGTGTNGQVSFWNGINTQTGSNNLFWDNTNNRLGIGTNTPTEKLDVNGNGRFSGTLKVNGATGNIIGGSTGVMTNTALEIAGNGQLYLQNPNYSTSNIYGTHFIHNAHTSSILLGVGRLNSGLVLEGGNKGFIDQAKFSQSTNEWYFGGGTGFGVNAQNGFYSNSSHYPIQYFSSNAVQFSIGQGYPGPGGTFTPFMQFKGGTEKRVTFMGEVMLQAQTGSDNRMLIVGPTGLVSAQPIAATGSSNSGTGATGQVSFWNGTTSQAGTNNLFWDATNQRLGIGTNTPAEALSVNGHIRSRKLVVTQTGWPDYVFHKNYNLQPLAAVEDFIQKNNHLPGIPSAKEVEQKGLDVGDTQALLLKKIEELTLYVIAQDKKMKDYETEQKELKNTINQLQKQVKKQR